MRIQRLLPFSLFLLPTLVLAAQFSDVPASYIYASQIRELSLMKIINGNPDGTFRPSSPVNRAAILKMLYVSMNKTPSEPEKICAPDVVPGAWYEAIVCHALGQRYVTGYANGNFGPGDMVTKAQALKMILNVMEFDQSLQSIRDYVPPAFTDVHSSDWFYNYVVIAYQKGILPIPGEDGNAFGPNTPLSRGEAAAYISNALKALKVDRDRMNSSSSTSSVSVNSSGTGSTSHSSSSSPVTQEQRDQANKDADARLANAKAHTKAVSLPFADTITSDSTKPIQSFSYTFTVTALTVADIHIAQTGSGGVSARLYKLKSDGTSIEYYLSYNDPQGAFLFASLAAGNYQLDVQPSLINTQYTVSAQIGHGDGNDGFSEAKNLDTTQLKTDFLLGGNLQNFYKFTVNVPTGASGKQMMVNITSEKPVKCLIYGLDNVTFGQFDLPTCNQSYLYPAGSYIVGISRDPAYTQRAEKQTYTVQLK